MLERLDHGQVRVVELGILAHKGDGHGRIVAADDGILPQTPHLNTLLYAGLIARDLIEVKGRRQHGDEVLSVEEDWHLVDAGHVVDDHDLPLLDLAVQGDLGDGGGLEGLVAAAGEEIGDDARAADRLDGMLGRLGLLLSVDGGHEGDVDAEEVGLGGYVSELGEGFDEGHGLDVADGSAEFD